MTRSDALLTAICVQWNNRPTHEDHPRAKRWCQAWNELLANARAYLNEKPHELLAEVLIDPKLGVGASPLHAAAERQDAKGVHCPACGTHYTYKTLDHEAAAEPEKPMNEPMQSYRFALQVIAAGEASDPAKLAREALDASPSAQPIARERLPKGALTDDDEPFNMGRTTSGAIGQP